MQKVGTKICYSGADLTHISECQHADFLACIGDVEAHGRYQSRFVPILTYWPQMLHRVHVERGKVLE
jgi:hypothetical protein